MESYLRELFLAPTTKEWVRFFEILAGIALTMGVGEAIRHVFHWPPEFTRKLVHISVAVLVFFAPSLFNTAVPALILGVAFTLFAYVSIKLGLLKSLHSVARGAYGTVYYPLAFTALVLLFWNSHAEIVSLSMLALGLGDASAAIVGESISKPILYHLTADKKSVQGSLAMLVTTALGLWLGLAYFDGLRFTGLVVAIAVVGSALIATAWEALSSRALDNLTIPLSVGFVLYYILVPTPAQDVLQFALGIALGVLIAVVAYYARFLKASGAVATFLLASFVYGIGGWKWTTPILTFFLLSSLLSKLGKSRKRDIQSVSEKSDTRDVGQVAANGGVAGLLVMAQYLFQNVDFYPFYLGAIAAVTADTWGTEVGTYFRMKTVSIVPMKEVLPGMSGGVSLVGIAGAFLGAAIVASTGYPWIGFSSVVLMATLAGVLGSIADSILGSTVQAQYRCVVCGKSTERKNHCSAATNLVGGRRWMNNDVVNWVCAIVGAGLMLALT